MNGAADLDQIAAEGAALEAGQVPALDLAAAPADAGPSEADQAAMWAGIPATFGSILSMAMPELQAVYSESACLTWGKAMLPVAKKYGWNSLDNLPEFALALVSLPFILQTGAAIKRRRAAGPAPAAAGQVEKPATAPMQGPSVNAGVV